MATICLKSYFVGKTSFLTSHWNCPLCFSSVLKEYLLCVVQFILFTLCIDPVVKISREWHLKVFSWQYSCNGSIRMKIAIVFDPANISSDLSISNAKYFKASQLCSDCRIALLESSVLIHCLNLERSHSLELISDIKSRYLDYCRITATSVTRN